MKRTRDLFGHGLVGWALSLLLFQGCAAPGGTITDPPEASPAAAAADLEEEAEAAAAKTAASKRIFNAIRWSTASEVENFGFDIYRGDEEEGPFIRLTEKPMPGAGTTDLPSKYVFEDDSIEEGKAYWYYVESIAMDGEREKFSPVFQSKPKFYQDEG